MSHSDPPCQFSGAARAVGVCDWLCGVLPGGGHQPKLTCLSWPAPASYRFRIDIRKRRRRLQRLLDRRDVDTGADNEHSLRARLHLVDTLDHLDQRGHRLVVFGQIPAHIGGRAIGRVDHSQSRGVRLDKQQRSVRVVGCVANRPNEGGRGRKRRHQHDVVDLAAARPSRSAGGFNFLGVSRVLTPARKAHDVVPVRHRGAARQVARREPQFGSGRRSRIPVWRQPAYAQHRVRMWFDSIRHGQPIRQLRGRPTGSQSSYERHAKGDHNG